MLQLCVTVVLCVCLTWPSGQKQPSIWSRGHSCLSQLLRQVSGHWRYSVVGGHGSWRPHSSGERHARHRPDS